MMDFLDEQRMSRLYEKFILEYYRREHPELSAGAPYISWALDDGFDDMLPAMHTDITLTRGRTVLIIDAKYYSHTTQQQFDKRSVHSGNLYQIFTYVKNKEAEPPALTSNIACRACCSTPRPTKTCSLMVCIR